MKSIILAAGRGTRLKPLTNNIPKCLVKVHDKALIEYHLAVLNKFNFDDIILVTGHESSKLDYLNCKKLLNPNYESTNMLYSLFCAIEEFDDDLIISYGDSVYDYEIINRVISSNKDICVASDQNWREYWESRYEDPLNDLETFICDSSKKIISLGAKPKDYSEINGQYIGLLKFSKKGALEVKKQIMKCFNKNEVNYKKFNDAYLTDFIQELISRKIEIYSVPITSKYIEIDDMDDLNSNMTQQRLRIMKS